MYISINETQKTDKPLIQSPSMKFLKHYIDEERIQHYHLSSSIPSCPS